MSAEEQAIVDREQLRLLCLFHYISGGITVAFGLLFGVWFAFMAMMFSMFAQPVAGAARCVADAEKCAPGAEAVPEFLPELFLAFFGVFIALYLALGVLEILSAWLISKRRRRLFAIIVAVPNLLFIPYGTLLSIFTILVLERSSVKALFGEAPKKNGTPAAAG